MCALLCMCAPVCVGTSIVHEHVEARYWHLDVFHSLFSKLYFETLCLTEILAHPLLTCSGQRALGSAVSTLHYPTSTRIGFPAMLPHCYVGVGIRTHACMPVQQVSFSLNLLRPDSVFCLCLSLLLKKIDLRPRRDASSTIWLYSFIPASVVSYSSTSHGWSPCSMCQGGDTRKTGNIVM